MRWTELPGTNRTGGTWLQRSCRDARTDAWHRRCRPRRPTRAAAVRAVCSACSMRSDPIPAPREASSTATAWRYQSPPGSRSMKLKSRRASSHAPTSRMDRTPAARNSGPSFDRSWSAEEYPLIMPTMTPSDSETTRARETCRVRAGGRLRRGWRRTGSRTSTAVDHHLRCRSSGRTARPHRGSAAPAAASRPSREARLQLAQALYASNLPVSRRVAWRQQKEQPEP